MKKSILFFVLMICITSLFAQLPESLYGIWEGKDRIVFFEQTEQGDDEIVILLKEYYGWYYDRAAESPDYAEKEVRTRNAATTRKAENIIIEDIENKLEAADSYAGVLKLKYSNHQRNEVPFVILDEKIYLDYLQQDSEITNYYRGNAKSKGFMISEQSIPENIPAYVIDGDKLYDVRYWKSDMDYSEETARLAWKDFEYNIPKHIFSSGNNYSCVSGRSKRIRNVVAPFEYKEENYIFNSDKSLLIQDKEPYLIKLADKKTFEDLMQVVKSANSRRKPDPEPIFPPNDVNWHWDLIDELEKDNQIIQAVRERQKSFGPRAKDIK